MRNYLNLTSGIPDGNRHGLPAPHHHALDNGLTTIDLNLIIHNITLFSPPAFPLFYRQTPAEILQPHLISVKLVLHLCYTDTRFSNLALPAACPLRILGRLKQENS